MEVIVKQVQGNLKIEQDRQKSQADLKITPKEFQVGEHVFIKVRPKNISLRLGSCAKLAPRYCGPFEILSRIRQVAYQEKGHHTSEPYHWSGEGAMVAP